MNAHDRALQKVLQVVGDEFDPEYVDVVRRAIESHAVISRFCRDQLAAFELAKRSYAENAGSIPVDFVPLILEVSPEAVQRAIASKDLLTIEVDGCLHVLTPSTKVWRSGLDREGNRV